MNSNKAKIAICIPTYNRPTELACLLKSFIQPVLKKYSGTVTGIIADNSDPMIQQINRQNCFEIENLHYSSNEVNLGYGGNVIKLAKLSRDRAQFLWLCSDNDEVNINEFHKMFEIANHSEPKFSLLSLKYHIKCTHESENIDTSARKINIPEKSLPFTEFLSNTNQPLLPFILL
jgi:GT2 family glycosyltransferase